MTKEEAELRPCRCGGIPRILSDAGLEFGWEWAECSLCRRKTPCVTIYCGIADDKGGCDFNRDEADKAQQELKRRWNDEEEV